MSPTTRSRSNRSSQHPIKVTTGKSTKSTKPKVTRTPSGHHIIIDNRKWRATNPHLPEAERKKLVSELMSARRAVGVALRKEDKDAEREARGRVNRAKVGLGERGERWWDREQEGEDDHSIAKGKNAREEEGMAEVDTGVR